MSIATSPVEQYAQFDPSKHPRGKPENAGQFAPKGSGSVTPSDKPDDSGGEQPDSSEPQKAPSPQQGQPEQPQQPQQPQPAPQPPEQSQEVIHASSMDQMPQEAVTGFEQHVLSPLRNQVSELDKIASNPMLGKRYAWESATHRGEKPGDPHAGSDGLERWKAHATQAGYNADEAIANHPELNDLTARLDKHRGWGSEPAIKKPQSQQVSPEQRYADLLKQAEPYRQPGENYSRNIHAPANRLEHSIQVGHSPSQLEMAADELEMRLKGAKPITTEPADDDPEPQPQAPEQSADEPDELDDRGHADNWNEVIKDHGKASPKQLKHALRAVEHMRQYHATNPHLTAEQRTAITSMLDSHHQKIQQALAAHEQPKSPTESPNVEKPSPASAEPKATKSVAERHAAVGDKIDLAPSPVKDLLRSLHGLRDTKRNGHVQTKELGADYAKEMYDHLKANKRSGDGFGDVHDMSAELGHGAMGYSSPAGNIAIVPPKFKNDDYDVRYTLPHESQESQVDDSESEPASDAGDSYEPSDFDQGDDNFDWSTGSATTTEDQPSESPSQQSFEALPEHHEQAKLLNEQANLHKSILGQKIKEMVGDDPLEMHAMHEAVRQTHQHLDEQRQARNRAYDHLMAEAVGEGLERTLFLNAVRRIEDTGGDLETNPSIGRTIERMSRAIANHPELYGVIESSPGFDSNDISSSLFTYLARNGGMESPFPLNMREVSTEPIQNELKAIDQELTNVGFSPENKQKRNELKKQRTKIKQKLLRAERDQRAKHEQLNDLLTKAASRLDQNAVEFSPEDPYYKHRSREAEQIHSHRMESDPEYRARTEETQRFIESTPFSRTGNKQRYAKIRRWLSKSYDRWRKYARQLGFAWGAQQEAEHPRGQPENAGQFVEKGMGAPAPKAAEPAKAPGGFEDLPLFSQPPAASKPPMTQPAQQIQQPPVAPAQVEPPQQVAQADPSPDEPVSAEVPPQAEQSPAAAETEQQGEPPVPTAEQQDAKMEKAMSKREQVNQFMVAKYQETEDESIKDQLLEDNLPLIRKAANKYARNSSELDDYMQEARMGFIKAIERFDPAKGMSFAGYASRHISNGLKLVHRFYHPGERSKDEAKRTKTISASQLPPDDDTPTSMEQLALSTGKRPTRHLEYLELQAALKQTLQDEFSDRDADVIQMRFGIGPYKNNPHEYPEIAAKLGIGTEGARQIVKRAAPALKRRLKDHFDPEDYAKSASEAKQVTEQDWRDATEKYGLPWERCFERGEPERYGMLDGQDAHIIAQALAEWYWNLPDRHDRERADHYAKQLGFSFGGDPASPVPGAKPATAPSGGGWGSSEEQLHPRAIQSVTIAGKTYSSGEWIPAGQAALATPVEKSKIELVGKSVGQQQPKSAQADIQSAFDKIASGKDRKSSLGHGDAAMVSMEDLRRNLPQYSRQELDAEIRKLRESGQYTMEPAHGRSTPEMREAGIKEGKDNLIFIARR